MRTRRVLGRFALGFVGLLGCTSESSTFVPDVSYGVGGTSPGANAGGTTARTSSAGGTTSKGGTDNSTKTKVGGSAASTGGSVARNAGGKTSAGGTKNKTAATDGGDEGGSSEGGAGGATTKGSTKTSAGGTSSTKSGSTKTGAGGTSAKSSTTATAKGGTTSSGGESGAGDEPVSGYFESGTWKGFGWADTYGTGNTITPEDFTDSTTWPMCAKGTVKASEDGSNGAMVGWNLNQAKEVDARLGTVTPTKDGIVLNIKNNSTTALRLQIQGPDGADDASQRWCTEIGSTSGEKIFVSFDAFNTECWPGGKGVAYKGEAIAQAIIQVPSTTKDVNFDFCVNGISEGDGGTTGGTGCDLNSAVSGSALTGTLTTSNKFARTSTNTGTPQIYVQNNVFGSGGDYTVSYNGPSFSIGSFNGSASTSGAPIGYPSLFIGSAGGDGQATAGSNLAKKVSALSKVPTALRWSGSGTQFNVAYDVWFNSGAGDSGAGGRSFLMVWFHRTSAIYAEGQSEGHSGGTLSLNGKTFDIYVSDQFEGRPIISYVAKSTISEWSFDLNDFIKDAKSRTSTRVTAPVINDNLYLTNVFAGTEVWSGASGLKIDKFCIQVQ